MLNEDRSVDYRDACITENTRGAYPIEFIPNSRMPCVAGHPTDVIFLTCDAFGVLPPVSRLTPAQAMYHFISGYTAKVAGTEVGVGEPQPTFSPCFGGPFLVWHPGKYAELLAEKLTATGPTCGWSTPAGVAAPYGTGKRMKLPFTRAIVDAIHAKQLLDAHTSRDQIFGLDVVTECPGVPHEVLTPRQTWPDPAAYDQAARKLAARFQDHFQGYEAGVAPEVRKAGPTG